MLGRAVAVGKPRDGYDRQDGRWGIVTVSGMRRRRLHYS